MSHRNVRMLGTFCINNYATHTNMQLNLISSCSNSCWSCFKECKRSKKQNYQYFQQSSSDVVENIDSLLQLVHELNIERIVVSSFGEPTAHPQYVEIVEELSKHVKKLVTVTNGGPTSKKIFQVLGKLATLSISLHGEELTHTCTTRNLKSYRSLLSFRNQIFNQIERERLNVEVVSSTLLTKELLGLEKEYLKLLKPSDRIRPSRLIYPSLLNDVEKYINSASLTEMSCILRRFGMIDSELKKSQEDQYIPECCCNYNNSVPLNVVRYLSNWYVECCSTCTKKNICSGLNIDQLTYRDQQNLNDELVFLRDSEELEEMLLKSLQVEKNDFIVPCITYEHCALVALRSILMKPYVFSLPIESFFTAQTYWTVRDRCRKCKKRCSFRASSVEKFKILPSVQLKYKTKVMYDLLQQRRSNLNEYFEYLMKKFKNILDIDLPDIEKNKLYVDIPI